MQETGRFLSVEPGEAAEMGLVQLQVPQPASS